MYKLIEVHADLYVDINDALKKEVSFREREREAKKEIDRRTATVRRAATSLTDSSSSCSSQCHTQISPLERLDSAKLARFA